MEENKSSSYIFKEYPDFAEPYEATHFLNYELVVEKNDFVLNFVLDRELNLDRLRTCEFLYSNFNQIVQRLLSNLGLSSKVLRHLNPYVDEKGILKIGMKESLKPTQRMSVMALLGCFMNFHTIPICEIKNDDDFASPCLASLTIPDAEGDEKSEDDGSLRNEPGNDGASQSSDNDEYIYDDEFYEEEPMDVQSIVSRMDVDSTPSIRSKMEVESIVSEMDVSSDGGSGKASRANETQKANFNIHRKSLSARNNNRIVQPLEIDSSSTSSKSTTEKLRRGFNTLQINVKPPVIKKPSLVIRSKPEGKTVNQSQSSSINPSVDKAVISQNAIEKELKKLAATYTSMHPEMSDPGLSTLLNLMETKSDQIIKRVNTTDETIKTLMGEWEVIPPEGEPEPYDEEDVNDNDDEEHKVSTITRILKAPTNKDLMTLTHVEDNLRNDPNPIATSSPPPPPPSIPLATPSISNEIEMNRVGKRRKAAPENFSEDENAEKKPSIKKTIIDLSKPKRKLSSDESMNSIDEALESFKKPPIPFKK